MRRAFILVLALTLGSCGNWPPDSAQIAVHLEENRSAMEELFSAFIDTQYHAMNYVREEGVFVEPDIQGGDTLLVGPESQRFRDLMYSADLFLIYRNAEYAWSEASRDFRGSYYTIVLVHDQPADEHWNVCEPHYSSLDCGYCDVDLGDAWRIKYSWYPQGFDDFRNLDQCMATGIATLQEN